MTSRARSVWAAAALLFLAGGGVHAQTPDSVVADTLPVEEARPRAPRGPNPFTVETSGRATPLRVRGEVVWAGSERAPRATQEPVDSSDADEAPPPPRRPRSDSTTTRRATRPDSATTRRTARADSTARRATRPDSVARRTARADSIARRAARADSASRRTSRADTATRRTPATGARPRTHTVARGETLGAIARRYGVTTAQIRALNPGVNGLDLERGTTLRLPAAARAPAARPATETERPGSATRPTATTRATTTTRRRSHTVASGETLYGIARRYGVTVDALRRANDIESNTVRPGQTLVVPPAS
ncbi:MAG TPA: LysM peptidoglycan-binding domain-containing protein [Longimicrobium sp.]|nr:LysM peptidoglycan-binding domain-containing protein [Longimicrobium sp.]